MPKKKETMNIVKPEQCQSCGICIGPDFIERYAYPVGNYRICGWCRTKLAKYGHIELDGRRATDNGVVCNWLYPDGTVKTMRMVASRSKGCYFIPADAPLPDGAVDMVKDAGSRS